MESTSDEVKVPISYCLPYAPPEVMAEVEAGQHRMVVKKSQDIWSLGVVVWELLMKKRLFPPDASPQSIKSQLLGATPLPWENKGANAANLRRLTFLRRHVLACLSRDPKARPTANALLDVLTHLFEEVSTQGTETLQQEEDEASAAEKTGKAQRRLRVRCARRAPRLCSGRKTRSPPLRLERRHWKGGSGGSLEALYHDARSVIITMI
eukprot:TRINITY_DN3852_c0_g1_i1.p1 TRINITY_DN3852_c0_g1~~TRINITY_DN3852_c0_g1_i1.p1  ORF type:complete len:209 (-),score=21.26 TRINITY_DN3852_c0_g1_i1:251-877(-)